MTDSVQVAIIGAGIAGSSLAFELSERGVETCLIEQGSVAAQGASTVPAALLNPHRGRTGRARTQDLDGLAAFWALAARLEAAGHASGAHASTVLRVAASPRQARLWQALEGVDHLASAQVPTPLHAPHGAIRITAGGWVEPAVLLPSLVAAATQRGVELREGVRLERIEGPRLLTSGGALHAQRVVLCTGAGAGGYLPLPPLTRVAGDGVRLAWNGPPLPALAGAVNAAFHAGGVWITGGHVNVESDDVGKGAYADEADAAGRPSAAADSASEPLRTALAWAIPSLRDAAVLGRWRGVRARAEQPYPVVREVAPNVTFYGAMAGRGFLCGPDISARLADVIAHDDRA